MQSLPIYHIGIGIFHIPMQGIWKLLSLVGFASLQRKYFQMKYSYLRGQDLH